MPVYTGLAVLSIALNGVNYAATCEDFELTVENQTEDSSGLNQRWEEAVGVKSRWSGQGNTKANDSYASLLVIAASNDIEIPFAMDTGLETITGNVILSNVGRQLRNAGIQMVPISVQGVGAPVITPT
jgi:hypothetical protein